MEILSIVLFLFGILQIILFFKIWGMTNDVSKIREILANFSQFGTNKTSKEVVEEKATIEVDDYVMEIKSQKEFRVKRVIDKNKFECIERYGAVIYTFKKDEIKIIGKK